MKNYRNAKSAGQKRLGMISDKSSLEKKHKSPNFRTILFNQDTIIASAIASRFDIQVPNVKEVAKRG